MWQFSLEQTGSWISVYSTFILFSVISPPGVFIFTSKFPTDNLRELEARSQLCLAANIIVLSQKTWCFVLLAFCQSAVQMGNWFTHLNLWSYPPKPKPGWLCAKPIGINVCLFRHRLSACYCGTSVPLFILLPHMLHKVNCWNDLYLSRKPQRHSDPWQNHQHGEHIQ